MAAPTCASGFRRRHRRRRRSASERRASPSDLAVDRLLRNASALATAPLTSRALDNAANAASATEQPRGPRTPTASPLSDSCAAIHWLPRLSELGPTTSMTMRVCPSRRLGVEGSSVQTGNGAADLELGWEQMKENVNGYGYEYGCRKRDGKNL
jgi:hypothetical protein